MIATKAFWAATAERAGKTAVQVFLAALLIDGVTLLSLDWLQTLNLALTAAVISVLTSIVSDVSTKDGPSLTKSEVVPPHEAEHAA